MNQRIGFSVYRRDRVWDGFVESYVRVLVQPRLASSVGFRVWGLGFRVQGLGFGV